MTNENPAEPTPEHVSFGADPAAPAPGRARRTGRALAWVAVGAIGATVLTGVAFAATNGETPSPAPSAANPGPGAPGEGRPGGGPGGPGGRGGHGGVFGGLKGDVLHGEFVVKDGDSTKTMLGQTGEVTAASSTSLTVKSTDGFTATWTLSSSTKVRAAKAPSTDGKKVEGAISDLKVGQTVNVAGPKTTATSGDATTVGIRPTAAQLQELRKNAPQWGERGKPGDAPAPTATPSKAAA